MFPIALGVAPVDIGASLSTSTFTTDPPRPGLDGRGRFRLYNASVDASVYVAVQASMPTGDTAAVRVQPQSWFPLELEVRPTGGVWAWGSRVEVKVSISVTAWS